jgi:hypothetical protein
VKGWSRSRTATRARLAGAFFGALAGLTVALMATGAFAAAGPAAPTITSTPSNPTNSSSATFTFSGAPSGGSYQCKLDGAAFASCPSPKSYTGLTAGSHTFQVRALDNKGKAGDPASFTWSIDLTPPLVSSIVREGLNPTNGASVAWTVTFSESVVGVDTADFQLATAGLGGSPSIFGVSGSGTTRTVSAGTGTGSGTIALSLVDNDSIADSVGNKLGGTGAGNGNFAGPSFTIDRTPPPAPGITGAPEDPTPANFADPSVFEFQDAESGVSFRCAMDGGAASACTSPKSYSGLGQGLHTFGVRAVDVAGNESSAATYSWTIVHPVKNFTISGNATATLFPGIWVPLEVTIDNPNNYAIHLVALTASASGNSSPPGCPPDVGTATANLAFQQSNVSSSNPLLIPGNGSVTIPASGPVTRPQVQMTDDPTRNQNDCKSKTFALTYQGLATK